MEKKNGFMLFTLLLAFVLMLSCAGEERKKVKQDVLHIAAAANLSYVIPELVDVFEREYGEGADMDIRVTKASSGSLTAQIRNSAPFDLFLAADTGYPRALYRDSLTVGEPVVYAAGIPVMVYRPEVEGDVGVACLTDPSVEKIAVAQPDLAPYGKAAIEILSGSGVLQQVEGKLVYGISITQTFQHVITAADAGFIAASLLHGEGGRELKKAGMEWIEFPLDAYDPEGLQQAMVLLDPSNATAVAFFKFMQGEKAEEILKKNGYRIE